MFFDKAGTSTHLGANEEVQFIHFLVFLLIAFVLTLPGINGTFAAIAKGLDSAVWQVLLGAQKFRSPVDQCLQ